MKYCPQCETRFDEEVIRFCTKDGTPLIEEAEPVFAELPSESIEEEEDDIGEITIIRRKDEIPVPPPELDEGLPAVAPLSERIVISTTEPERVQNVRSRGAATYYPPPPPTPNTAKTVALTVFGTVVVLGLGALLFWFLQKDNSANKNGNANNVNQNVNLNTNLGFDSNFNFNATPVLPPPNINLNTNFNANIKTPTPTPTPKPSPSLTPSPTPDTNPTPAVSPTPRFTNIGPRSPSPTPRSGPRPTPNPSPNQ